MAKKATRRVDAATNKQNRSRKKKPTQAALFEKQLPKSAHTEIASAAQEFYAANEEWKEAGRLRERANVKLSELLQKNKINKPYRVGDLTVSLKKKDATFSVQVKPAEPE